MTAIKVAREVAEAEFDRMCTARRVDVDESLMSEEELKDFTKLKNKILSGIQDGRLVVDADANAIYTPPTPGAKSLTIYRATGATFMAMDNSKGKEIGKMVAILTELTRSGPADISKLEAADFNFCSKLVNLFLAQG